VLYGKTQYPFYSVPASIKDITFKLIFVLLSYNSLNFDKVLSGKTITSVKVSTTTKKMKSNRTSNK